MSLPMRVSNAIKLIEPFLMSEIVVQQSQHTLVATALDHFANVVNHIVEQEGCGTPLKPPAPFCKRAEIKRLFAEFDSENMTDGKGGTMTLLPIDDEVDTKDLPVQVETAAAVVAIVLGEKNIAGDSIDVIN